MCYWGGGGGCILPNFKVKKSVYTDNISMSGRSVTSEAQDNYTKPGLQAEKSRADHCLKAGYRITRQSVIAYPFCIYGVLDFFYPPPVRAKYILGLSLLLQQIGGSLSRVSTKQRTATSRVGHKCRHTKLMPTV